MKIANAGNTEVPAYLALQSRGFSVTRSGVNWTAVRDDVELVAAGPLELLGLAALIETRGRSWAATDSEIEKFVHESDQE